MMVWVFGRYIVGLWNYLRGLSVDRKLMTIEVYKLGYAYKHKGDVSASVCRDIRVKITPEVGNRRIIDRLDHEDREYSDAEIIEILIEMLSGETK